MIDLAQITRAEAEDFLYREGRLIDERRFDEWFDLYTEEAVYWLPMGDDEVPGLGPSVIYDDHYFLARRVYRLVHTRVFSQRPVSRTVHLISNVEVGEMITAGTRPELIVYSAQVVHEVAVGQQPAIRARRPAYACGPLRTPPRLRRRRIEDHAQKVRARRSGSAGRELGLHRMTG